MAQVDESTKSTRKGNKRRGRTQAGLDMTAMVDVAFLLLTFFVLSASLQTVFQIRMSYPPKCEDCGNLEVNENKMLTLILDRNSKVYHFEGVAEDGISKSNFTNRGIRSLLQNHLKKEDPIVVIKATKEASYGRLIDTIDELIITGHKKYVIAPFTTEDAQALASHKTVN